MSLLDKNKQQANKNVGSGSSSGSASQNLQQHNPEPEEPPEVTYALLHGLKNMTIHLDAEDTVEAVNGSLVLTAEQDAKLQKLVAKGRPDIVQNMRKIDRAEAERVAREFLARNASRQGHRGASSSADKHRAAVELASDAPINLDAATETDMNLLTGGPSAAEIERQEVNAG